MRIEIFRQRQILKSKKLKSYILDNFALVHDNFQFRPSKVEVVLFKNWYLK